MYPAGFHTNKDRTCRTEDGVLLSGFGLCACHQKVAGLNPMLSKEALEQHTLSPEKCSRDAGWKVEATLRPHAQGSYSGGHRAQQK